MDLTACPTAGAAIRGMLKGWHHRARGGRVDARCTTFALRKKKRRAGN